MPGRAVRTARVARASDERAQAATEVTGSEAPFRHAGLTVTRRRPEHAHPLSGQPCRGSRTCLGDILCTPVTGAYGYSRLREWFFGGVTRDLLAKTAACCLMSH